MEFEGVFWGVWVGGLEGVGGFLGGAESCVKRGEF